MAARVCGGMAAFLVLAAGSTAGAIDLVNWNVSAYAPANNGGAVTPLPPEFTALHVSASAITAGPGVQSLDSCSGPLALTACAGLADMWVQYFSIAFDPADYFQWTVTADPGYQIAYEGFQMPMGVLYLVDPNPGNGRSRGPKTWELKYSLDGFATPGISLGTVEPFLFNITGPGGATVGASEEAWVSGDISAIGTRTGTVTFRWYGYGIENTHAAGPLGYGAGPTNRTYFGFPRFDAVIRGSVAPIANPTDPGACCRNDGTCADGTFSSCQAAAGVFQGLNSQCSGVSCPSPVACCMSDGTCTNLPAAVCGQQGGSAQGAGSTCATANCNGACCKSDGTCSEMSQASCVALGVGNVFQGFGSLCSGVTCPGTMGCCSSAGVCADLVLAACAASGGTPAGGPCATASCNGACCTSDGTCSEMTQAACLALGAGHVFQGPGSVCSGIACPAAAACCTTAGCSNLVPAACTASGGLSLGAGTACATAQCQGACCNSDGTCTENITQTACNSAGGVFRGGGSTCVGAVCPVFLETLAPNNGSGGVFMNLTPAGAALNLMAFASYFSSGAGTPASVEVYSRPGTYVGFSTSSAGWTAHGAIGAVSAGTTTLSGPVNFTAPIPLAAGTTTGLYLHSVTTGGGLRYQGTGTTSTGTFSNGDLTLTSAHARTGTVAFGGTQNTPRAFSGRIYYERAAAACYANCDQSTGTPVLNVADFTCFLTKFAGGDPYANCDGSVAPPPLNVADFTCFLTKFAGGCP